MDDAEGLDGEFGVLEEVDVFDFQGLFLEGVYFEEGVGHEAFSTILLVLNVFLQDVVDLLIRESEVGQMSEISLVHCFFLLVEVILAFLDSFSPLLAIITPFLLLLFSDFGNSPLQSLSLLELSQLSELFVGTQTPSAVGLSKQPVALGQLWVLKGNGALELVVAHFDEDSPSVVVFIKVFEDCTLNGEFEGFSLPVDVELEFLHFEGEVDVVVVENVVVVQDFVVEFDREVAREFGNFEDQLAGLLLYLEGPDELLFRRLDYFPYVSLHEIHCLET